MKNTLITFLLIAAVQFSFAQNTIAKLKFEEAEEAYTSNNFELTLTKLKEVETLLKGTNPRTLYLQILSQTKIIERNPLGDYDIIESTKKSINKYLMDYENLPENEDKYREIYKISESSKKFLITKQEFESEIKRIETEKEAKREEEIYQNKMHEDLFMSYNQFNYETGLSIEETKKKYPELQLKYLNIKKVGIPDELVSSKKGFGFYVKNDKVIGYYGEIQSANFEQGSFATEKVEFDKILQDAYTILHHFQNEFNFSPSTELLNGKLSYLNKYNFSYSWEKNGKTIRFIFSCYKKDTMWSSFYWHAISITSINENLAK